MATRSDPRDAGCLPDLTKDGRRVLLVLPFSSMLRLIKLAL